MMNIEQMQTDNLSIQSILILFGSYAEMQIRQVVINIWLNVK